MQGDQFGQNPMVRSFNTNKIETPENIPYITIQSKQKKSNRQRAYNDYLNTEKGGFFIYIKYADPDIVEAIQKNNGNWIDLRSADDYDIKQGESLKISLGVAMELPYGYEAHLAPRSSTLSNFGLMMNSIGIIDDTYCGDDDIWTFPAYAIRDTHVSKNDRICQFRIMEVMPLITFIKVDKLGNPNRGGLGSTGIK